MAILFLFPALLTYGQNLPLEEGFKNPPESALPRTWWHWTNSNVTKEGITKDLEWMKRVGIGGMHLADVASGQGQTVENKISFRTPEWIDAVRHTATEAERIGLEMTVFSSAGWSLTGGPWVKPEMAMKKLVWSEMTVTGGKITKVIVPQPPSAEGPIRNLSRAPQNAAGDAGFYKDVKVLAFPAPADETGTGALITSAVTGTGNIDPAALLDDDLNSFQIIKAGKDKSIVWLQYTFNEPVTIRAITLANSAGIPFGKFMGSADGTDFSTILMLPGPQLYRSGKVATYSFEGFTGKCFRFEFTGAPLRPADVMAETNPKPDSLYRFSEMKLYTSSKVNRWEDKAGFYHLFNYDPVASPEAPATSVIDPSKIVDLTSSMLPDGTLNWKVPQGKWTIMRFGYSLTGAKNRPAVPAGSGYEVDKLSREYTEAYIKEYTRPLIEALGQLYGKRLQSVMLDSWEAGMQNWTNNMISEFGQRRKYDLTPFLPCLAGYVVGSSTTSDRVLWDFRRTLADMFAENHYKVLTDYLNKQGIKTYGEASGVSLEILEDALLCKKYVDIPMGEFWFRSLHPDLMYYQDIRGAASASHVYGKPVTAAESFTGGGYESPASLKAIGDYWFTQGVNRIVFHTSAHQPLDTKPGNTMVGTHINRNITWAENAEPFMKYLARNSYMLQQGKFVADLAYLLDEGAPSTMPIWGSGLTPAVPDGYDFDYINADVLLTRMSVASDGKLVLPDGMKYSVLVLPEAKYMSIPVARKILELVKDGARVTGPRPVSTPGFTGFPDSEKEFESVMNELWGDLDGISRTKRVVGKGMICWGMPLKTVLEISGARPDLEYSAGLDSKINWIHRQTNDADIYFVVNSSDKALNTEIRFRVSGKEAEIWDPASGTIEPSDYKIEAENTIVPAYFEQRQSAFFVFRKNTLQEERTTVSQVAAETINIDGPWNITFPSGMGAPEKVTITAPESWTVNADEGIKYFSGTAVYEKNVEISGKLLGKQGRFILDLGRVGDMAEVKVNGTSTGLLWKAPYTTDITSLLKKGQNNIEISVTNQWTNRIIGDMNSAPEKKVLNASLMMRRGGILPESGLLGPVKLVRYPVN